MKTRTITRRALLKGGLAAGAGLTIGFRLPAGRPARAQAKAFKPNAWVGIDRDGVVTVITGQSEMGQGTLTTIGMIIADELDADWSKVKIQQGGADRALGNPNFMGGSQATVGSRSIRDFLPIWRRAGAAAREMLAGAAARRWGVPLDAVVTDQGVVYHRPTGRKAAYADLVDEASQLPVPQNPRLKTRDQFKLIGKRVRRRDTPDKVTGRAIFGLDVVVPGMLVATVERCPVFGGKVKTVDAGPAKAVKGVKDVVQITSGVAVVADGYWAAKRGRDALRIEWDEGPNASLTSAEISRGYAQLAQQPGKVARRDGDPAKALGEAAKKIEAAYEVPFLAHATMETMNCTAHAQADRCDLWVATQGQTAAQARAAQITGLPPEKVVVHTTFLGGGFGRRFETDFVADAVEVSKAVKAPVKVIWSREDDMRHDFYRPATYNVLRAGLDAGGEPVAWTHRIVSPSLLIPRKWPLPPSGIDPAMMAVATDLPYAIPNLEVDWVFKDFGVPVGFWRSVSSSQNAFITESFVDELAHAAGQDPFAYRRELLGKSPKHKGVLEMAAKQAGWGTPLPRGRARGIAVAFSYGSYAAEVAEVSLGANGRVRVDRIVCAVDTGFAANPDQIRAQMEGGIIYALTAVLYGQITIDKGRVVQSNFHDYPMLRINETPRIEVHIMESGDFVGGAGEPGVPPLAPAVCNAVFALTGTRARKLPIDTDALRRA